MGSASIFPLYLSNVYVTNSKEPSQPETTCGGEYVEQDLLSLHRWRKKDSNLCSKIRVASCELRPHLQATARISKVAAPNLFLEDATKIHRPAKMQPSYGAHFKMRIFQQRCNQDNISHLPRAERCIFQHKTVSFNTKRYLSI